MPNGSSANGSAHARESSFNETLSQKKTDVKQKFSIDDEDYLLAVQAGDLNAAQEIATRYPEEMFADAYAGIDRFRLVKNATQYTDLVRDQVQRVSKENESATRDTRGAPERKFSIAGERSKTADLEALSLAKEMQEQDVDPETIFRQTGWFAGADGKWRYEIDDSMAQFRKDGDARLMQEEGYRRLETLTQKWADSFDNGEALTAAEEQEMEVLQEEYKDVVWEEKYLLRDFLKHDELFEAYPYLNRISLAFDDLPAEAKGYFSKRDNTIVLSDKLFGKEKETVLHEIQHVIQKVEDFARGASPEYWNRRMEEGFSRRWTTGEEMMPSELYRNTAGEIEARDTAARMNLSAEQRRNTFPNIGDENTVFAEENSEQYSISETDDGRAVAVVDNDILEGIDTTTWDGEKKEEAKAAAKKALLEFKNGIQVNSIAYKVNRTSRREYTRSNETEKLANKDRAAFLDKMRAAANADDVITATTSWGNDGRLRHPRKDNFVDFAHGDVLIQAGQNQYEAKSVVGITNSGEYVFYDVVDMNPTSFNIKEELSTTAAGKNTESDIQESSYESRLSESEEIVKPKFSFDDEDYLLAVQAGDMDAAQEMVMQAAREAMPDTKIIDEDGQPLVVYRGKNSEYTVFDRRRIRKRSDGIKGFYFAPPARRESVAAYYGNGETKAFYLSINNPLVVSADERIDSDRIKGFDGIVRLSGKDTSMEYYNYSTDEMETENLKKGDIIEIVAFYPEQIKSADPVTYDDNGKIIPLSERFNPKKTDIRYSIDEEDYLLAVQAGDMDAAQEMVDEAAKAWGGLLKYETNRYEEDGYTSVDYKYTYNGRPVAWVEMMVNDENAYVERIDVEAEYRNQGFGTNILQELSNEYGAVYVAPDNGDASRLYSRIGVEAESDYDYYDQGYGVYKILPFGSNQTVKSADPVTYDDNGKVIPLSERFNPENNDIRYSIEDDVRALDEEYASILQDGKKPHREKADLQREIRDTLLRGQQEERLPTATVTLTMPKSDTYPVETTVTHEFGWNKPFHSKNTTLTPKETGITPACAGNSCRLRSRA